MEPVRWRLTSALHGDVDEPDEGASIKIAVGLKRLADLQLIRTDGTPFLRVPLTEDGGGWKPVFYRRRSSTLDGKNTSGIGTLDAVVFGRQREKADGEIQVTLWQLRHDGRVVDCPGHLIDAAAIQGIAEAFGRSA